MSTNDCQTPATACDLETAIEGDGGTNVPTNGEEIVVLTGSYPTQATEVSQGAANLNIHGEAGQPRPIINQSSGGRLSINSATLSYLQFENTGSSESVNLSGTGTIDRVFMRGSGNSSSPWCQCRSGLVRNSVFVTDSATTPAIGLLASGTTTNMPYRNITAYSSNPATPAISVVQLAMSGTLTATIHNSVALNGAGGSEVVVDGNGTPGSTTITFDNSNYRNVSASEGGVVQDGPGGHQTALPSFTNAAANDFSELAGSVTINAGLTDPLNGTLDFAGNPRVVDGATDIGAVEYLPPGPTPPGPTPSGATPPTFRLGKKVKMKPNGKGTLGFACTSPSGDQCVVSGTLTGELAAAAKKGVIGQVSGTVAGGQTGKLSVKLTKRGRRSLRARGKLRAQLSGSVTNRAGVTAALSGALRLKLASK